LRVIELTATVPKKKRIERYWEVLLRNENERAGFAQLLYGAYQRLRKEGLNEPAAVSRATEEVTDDNDWVAEFVELHCVLDTESSTDKTDIHKRYKKHAYGQGIKKPVSPFRLYGLLKTRYELKDKKDGGVRKFGGIRLLPEPPL